MTNAERIADMEMIATRLRRLVDNEAVDDPGEALAEADKMQRKAFQLRCQEGARRQIERMEEEEAREREMDDGQFGVGA